jgi:catechol 2,3-dioxygenase-like lactoylglutathione lyase family enzyme
VTVLGLDHVQVVAPRSPGVEAEARAFYGGLLGLNEIEKPDALKPKGGVWFSLGRGELHVGLEDDFRPARKAHPAFVVDDLDGMRILLETAGYETFGGEEIPGVRRFHVNDPFGNRIELVERQ